MKKDNITCTMCGKTFDFLDKDGNNIFDITFGYGSRHDEERYKFKFCCSCMDKMVEMIIPMCKEDPLVDDDFVEHELDINNVLHSSWGPKNVICARSADERSIDKKSIDEFRVVCIKTDENYGHKAGEILLFDGTYLRCILHNTTFREYILERLGKTFETEWMEIPYTDDEILYIRKTDSKWLMDAMKSINKINAYIPEKKFQKRWINYYQEKLEKERR